MTKISIIIPAYNEEATVIQLLESVASQQVDNFTFEVIVIDDGSKDRTVELLETRPELYTTLIKQPKNGGKGAAVKSGLAEASGEFILFQDADLEYDPSDYAALLFPVRKFDADVVMGSRFIAPDFMRVSYFWHKVGNRIITLLFNMLNNTSFTDIYSCYLMYRRNLLDPNDLTTTGWEQHAEILSRTVTKTQDIYEVPVSYHGRSYKEGKKIKAHHIIAVFWTIFIRRLIR